MDLAVLTGDHADNQQHNEAVWVRQLIEGGTPLTPNSGIKSDYSECRPENQGRAGGARDGRGDSRRADLHGRPGLRRPRLQGARLLRPRRALRRRLRHVPDLAGSDGPRAVAHLHAGRPAPGRHPRAHLHRERKPRRPGSGQRGRRRPLRGHRNRLLQGRAEHVRAADRPEPRPEPAVLACARLRRPPRRAGAALPRPGAAEARVFVRHPGGRPRLRICRSR